MKARAGKIRAVNIRAALPSLIITLTGCGLIGHHGGPAAAPTLAPGAVIRDGLLYAAIKAKLAGNDLASATRVSVGIHSGTVTLSGRVPDRQTRERDVQLVRAIRGVRAVNDQLRIGRSRTVAEAVADVGLVASITGRLAAQVGVNISALQIDAVDGKVTLRGQVKTAALKSTMIATARKTPGVRNVVDRIAVK